MAGRAEVWCYPSKTILLFILPVVFFSLSSFLFFFNKQGGGDGDGTSVYKQYKLLCVCRAITGYGVEAHVCCVKGFDSF